MGTFDYYSEEHREHKEYLIANDEATLLHIINMGCLELNPWSSTVKNLENPTFCIIDLDPDKNSFDQVIEAPHVTKAILDDMGLPSYPKTSGSTGLHIYKYTFEQSKEFARIIATLVNHELPKYTRIGRHISDRKGKGINLEKVVSVAFMDNKEH